MKKVTKKISLLTSFALLGASGALALGAWNGAFADSVTENEKPLFFVEGSQNTIIYGLNENYGTNEYTATLNAGDVLHYNDPIDLRQADSANGFAHLRVIPTVEGESDIKKMRIKLTDAYDSENYVSYIANPSANSSYWQVGFSGTPHVGHEGWNNKIHIENEYGAWNPINFTTKSDFGSGFVLFLDLETKWARCNQDKGVYGHSVTDIADLDDPLYFSNGWQGFTTGDVYLSVEVLEYAEGKTSAQIAVISGAGNNLDGSMSFQDVYAPEIKINYGDYDKNSLPSGAIGYSCEILDATAYDAESGVFAPKMKVYKNYGESNQKEVIVENGKFVPSSSGTYTVVYYAEDENGNKSDASYDIFVDETPVMIEYQLNGKEKKTAFVGEQVVLPTVTFDGGMGALNTIVSVKTPDGNFVELNGLQFVPEKVGEYKVVFAAIDEFSQKKSYEYDVDVTVSEKPVLAFSEKLPKYFLQGKNYLLPTTTAYDYKNDAVCEVSVTTDNGSIKDSVYTPETVGEVKLTYNATGAGGATTEEYTVPVISVADDTDPYAIDLRKYFAVNGGVNVSTTASDVTLTATEDGMATFVNKLLVTEQDTWLKIGGEVELLFEDIAKNATLKIGLIPVGNTIVLTVNGQEVARVSGISSEYTAFGFTLDGALRVGNKTVKIDTFEGNVSFNGFSKGCAYLSFNMKKGSTVSINKIGVQDLNENITFDMVRPLIVTTDLFGGFYQIGEVYKICAAYAMDVLDPSQNNLLYVQLPDGNYAKDVNGVTLNGVPFERDYYLPLTVYGGYNISYLAENASGGEEFFYRLNVIDTTAPELTLNMKKVKTSAKVGTNVTVAKAIATDNNSENVSVVVCAIDPKGTYVYLTGNSFKAYMVGTWEIRYMAYDSEGNFDMQSYKVKVTK